MGRRRDANCTNFHEADTAGNCMFYHGWIQMNTDGKAKKDVCDKWEGLSLTPALSPRRGSDDFRVGRFSRFGTDNGGHYKNSGTARITFLLSLRLRPRLRQGYGGQDGSGGQAALSSLGGGEGEDAGANGCKLRVFHQIHRRLRISARWMVLMGLPERERRPWRCIRQLESLETM